MGDATLIFGYSSTSPLPFPVTAAPATQASEAASWVGRSGSSQVEDDGGPPRFENEIVFEREVDEARLLAGYHDIDPQRKVQVLTQ